MIIDDWVKDTAIRRDALTAFVLLLVAVTVIIAIVVSGGASTLGDVLSSTPGKIIFGTGAVGAMRMISVRRHRKRQQDGKRPASAETPQVQSVPGLLDVPTGDDSGDPARPPTTA
ncbi:hypothetical protein ACFQ1S_26570 [Kibdelosporangium lantanae]|uniref:DUF3040 domain-containing protein n=1 Tax=Kibdelosporangium lantanae TaxID=1497396 RepID=A0ABW3MGT3_9PSEU